jgi:hypothetical protein
MGAAAPKPQLVIPPHSKLWGILANPVICPENRDLLTWVEEGAEFSSEETVLLLEGTPLNRLPAATLKKLEQVGIVHRVDILPRNLKALFERKGKCV